MQNVSNCLLCWIVLQQFAMAQLATPSAQLPQLRESIRGGPIASIPADPFMTPSQEQQLLAVLQAQDDSSWQQLTPLSLAELLSPRVVVEVEWFELELCGVEPQTILNTGTEIAPAALGARLERLLTCHDLTFNLSANRLVITSRDAACECPPVRLYDVTPLVERLRSRQRLFDFESLLRVVQESVEPDEWVQAGGTSSLSHLIVGAPGHERGILIAACPTLTHMRLQSLFQPLNSLQPSKVDPTRSLQRAHPSQFLELSDQTVRQTLPNQPVFDDRLRGGFF